MSNPLSSKYQLSWLSLGGIILLQSVSVTSSLFSTYSSLLGKQFSISRVQVINLIVALETGRLFEWFPSAAADRLPPWTILLIVLSFGSVGYGVQYLYIADKIHTLSYWQVFLLCLLAGNSICWIQTYCYFAAVTNFNKHKNIAALISCYSALSRKVYTSLVEGIQGRIGFQNPSTCLLLNCLVPASVGLVVEYMLCLETQYSLSKTCPAVTSSDFHVGDNVTYSSALVKAAHWLIIGRWRSKITPELPCVGTTANCITVIKGIDNMNEEVGEDGKRAGVKVNEGMEKVGKVKLGDEHGVKNIMMSLDFWLFFWVNACGPMLGLVYVNNLRQISESHGNYEVSSLLAVSSTSGFFGRIFLVLFEEYTRLTLCFRRRSILSKPASIVLMMIPMPVSFFLLINGSKTGLYISTGILGACSGAIRATTASTISELFGPQNSVVNQNIVLTNIPIGTLLFGYLDVINYETGGGGNYGICKGFECHHKTSSSGDPFPPLGQF
ncbi:Protein nuclear fusion defective 4 [Vitis vinifera]|uniref:Protein nuclear fusion defective 4 n=1 Tax=Vitis vinifera TaxID=29760 RepID=A0A438J2N1_VITVI|nr:Protein nuclear fusion defective 4 [Vitis vinifera]